MTNHEADPVDGNDPAYYDQDPGILYGHEADPHPGPGRNQEIDVRTGRIVQIAGTGT